MAIAQRDQSDHSGAGAATSIVVDVPTNEEDDLLLMFVAAGEGEDGDVDTPSGWTVITANLFTAGSPGSHPHISIFYRFSNGSEPSSYTVSLEGGSPTTGLCALMVALSGVDTTTPIDASIVTSETGSPTGSPDPPAVTTVTNKAWVITGYLKDDNDRPSPGVPSGYGQMWHPLYVGGGGNGCCFHVARKEISPAGSENPGTFSNGDSEEIVTFSFAIRPIVTGWANIQEVKGVDEADIGKVIGVAKDDIAEINGIAV